jgi:hypothetical protein
MLTSCYNLLVSVLISTSAVEVDSDEYLNYYSGQIQGLRDTTILIELRCFLDEGLKHPITKQHRVYVDVDSVGHFDTGLLRFYYPPKNRTVYYTEFRALGMRMVQKSKVLRYCGSLPAGN